MKSPRDTLDRPHEQIRLLRNVSQNFRYPEFSLAIYDLSFAPPFIALSYEWGDARHGIDVLVNNQPFHIRKNLWLFLVELSQKQAKAQLDMDSLFWVDAICIKQDQDSEKHGQLRLMGEIYKTAVRVFAWLGLIPDKVADVDIYHDDTTFNSQNLLDSGLIGPPPVFGPRFLLKMARCSYWKRRWIIQELLNAQSVMVCWGPFVYPWNRLLDGLKEAELQGEDGKTLHETQLGRISAFYNPSRLDLRTSQSLLNNSITKLPLAELMLLFADSKCLLAHDRIYAFLSICEEGSHIEVQYDIPVENAFLQIILSQRKLNHWPKVLEIEATYVMQCPLTGSRRRQVLDSKPWDDDGIFNERYQSALFSSQENLQQLGSFCAENQTANRTVAEHQIFEFLSDPAFFTPEGDFLTRSRSVSISTINPAPLFLTRPLPLL